MAREYAKTLTSLGSKFHVIGRGSSSAKEFKSLLNIPVFTGGVEKALISMAIPDQAIIAVGVENLANTATILMESGVKRILLEKPGGVGLEEIQNLKLIAHKKNCTLLLAYNRRFYSSTEAAIKMIEEDGGASSCTFEFTEWSHIIGPLKKGPGVKSSWFLSNSTHLVDLAFHICGFPKELNAINEGSLSWHPSSSRFCGSGITSDNVLFSYIADWTSPGRWGLEVMTSKRRIILRPLEEVRVVELGSIDERSIEIQNEIDIQFKPGIHKMVMSFLEQDDRLFCSIDEQLSHMDIYNKMAGY